METTAFFEKKISLNAKDINRIKNSSIEDIILEKAKVLLEEKCSEHGFVIPGSLKLISRSMGYFEPARFTGDAVYYVKMEGKVIYPADGVRVSGEVIRKNKMGMYVVHRNAIRIQVPRDLHLGSEEYESVKIGDIVDVEIKRSRFQINDTYILASGMFIENKTENSDNKLQNIPSSEQGIIENEDQTSEEDTNNKDDTSQNQQDENDNMSEDEGDEGDEGDEADETEDEYDQMPGLEPDQE
jgi:hypothetical protein